MRFDKRLIYLDYNARVGAPEDLVLHPTQSLAMAQTNLERIFGEITDGARVLEGIFGEVDMALRTAPDLGSDHPLYQEWAKIQQVRVVSAYYIHKRRS